MKILEDEIFIDNYSVTEIAEQYGTPVYVYNAKQIRENYRAALATARKYYNNFNFFYAIKACNNLNIAEILVKEGAGIDAASVNEIKLAKCLGLENERIMFTGNFLSDNDLEEGFNSGAIINLDDESLLKRLLNFGKPDVICFRINPGYGYSNVGEYVTNAGPRAKFGIHPHHALEAYQAARDAGIKRFGVHMMPGSCVLNPEYFELITDMLLEIVSKIIVELDIEIEFIDLGGGLGIPYTDKENPLDLDQTFSRISSVITNHCNTIGAPLPKLLMEPARYFVGNAGFLIGKVHAIKNTYNTIIGTDVSMNVLARPAMYNAYHHILVNGKESHRKEEMGLCGQVCENTDYWCKERPLPTSIEEGDLFIVKDAGAYGFTMSYEYNGRLRPAEVLIDENGPRLIRKRETFEDSIAKMVLTGDVAQRAQKLGNL